jgi:plastocyanin
VFASLTIAASMTARMLRYLIPSIVLVCASFLTEAQSTRTIRGLDFHYLPDTVWMVPGDSIRFQPQGIHDMVQTDSAYWAIGQAIGNGGFTTVLGQEVTFAIDTAGTYYFVCSPHGIVGMVGVLIVDSMLTTSVPDGCIPVLRTYPVPAQEALFIAVDLAPDDHVVVYDPSGRRVDAPFESFGLRTVVRTGHLAPAHYTFLVYTDSGARKGRGTFIIGPK